MQQAYQHVTYQVQRMGTQKSKKIPDNIFKRLQGIESRIKNQSKSNLCYQLIVNKPINPLVLIKLFFYKFEVPQIAKFKGKELTRAH